MERERRVEKAVGKCKGISYHTLSSTITLDKWIMKWVSKRAIRERTECVSWSKVLRASHLCILFIDEEVFVPPPCFQTCSFLFFNWSSLHMAIHVCLFPFCSIFWIVDRQVAWNNATWHRYSMRPNNRGLRISTNRLTEYAMDCRNQPHQQQKQHTLDVQTDGEMWILGQTSCQ